MAGTRFFRAVGCCPKGGVERRILDSMLLASGELNYPNVSVQDVLDRAKVSRRAFHRHFTGTEDCFVVAYQVAADRLYQEVISSARSQAGWREGFRSGVETLLRFVAEHPLHAKALLLDVRSAPARAWNKHDDVVERFSRALDTARQETDPHSPPPRTAEFIVSAIESVVCMRIAARDTANLDQLLPELVHLGVLFFFGEGPAGEELG